MITMSYTDESGRDGSGAQVYRYAVCCGLAQKFRIKWRHVGIKKIDSNPLDTLSSSIEREKFLDTLNNFIKPEDATVRNPCLRITIRRTLSSRQLRLLLFLAGCMRSPLSLIDFTLLRPQTYAFYYANTLERYFENLTNRLSHYESNRGSKLVVAHIKGALKCDRQTNTDILYSILQSIQKVLNELSHDFQIVIITDLPKNSITWKLDSENDPGTLQYWSSQGIINNDGTISLGCFDFENEYSQIRNLKIIRDVDPLECWRLMSSADILVGCDSSLGIIGGYLNQVNNKAVRIFPSQLDKSLPEGWFRYENSVAGMDKNKVTISKVAEVLVNHDKF